MAALACTVEVKDREYTNWLSVNLALYYMKSGMHAFIKREVDCLHQSLVQKIYGGQTVSLPPCTICHASRVKRDEYGVWAFKKRCRSDCDAWLAELLALHVNPKSEEIYWNNSNVPSWPFQPWECAKVFMPRGQQFSNSGPAECDAQSLLMLLAKCTHFHLKLSANGLSLTQTISTIRNKIMHDGEMKLSDDDRMSYIQQIIQLLEDPVCLKSLEDCKTAVSNIHKIDNDSLDLDIEMTAWRAVVNEFRLELGTQEKRTLDTVDSLKEEYKKLREQITKRFEDVVTKKLLIQEDVQSVKNQTNTLVQQEKKHQDMPTTVTSQEVRLGTDVEDLGTKSQECETGIPTQRGNNSKRKRKVVGNGIPDSGIPEKIHRSVLNRCLPVLLRDLDFKTVSIYIQQKEIFDDVTMSDILDDGAPSDKKKGLIQRIQQRDHNTYEKFKDCLVLAKQGDLKDMLEEEEERVAIDKDIETDRKRRPESDGLKQLKNETEDILGTFRTKGFIQTTQTKEAKKLLQKRRSILISGNPGEGKTSTALHLINNDDYTNQCVVVKSLKDWKKVDTDWVKIVVLEDIFGRYDLDPECLKEWVNKYLQTIQDHVDVGKLQVIITIRKDILLKVYSKLKSFKLFSSEMSLTLSSEKLEHSDKMSILNRELKRKNKDMNVGEKEECIAKFSGMIGFPQCCSLFAQDKHLFSQGSDFFRSPEKFLVDNIRNLEPNSFLSLAFLFCIVEIEEEYLSPSQIKESKKYLPVLEDLAKYLHISFDESTVISLRESYDYYLGLYVRKVLLYKHHSEGKVSKFCIHFSHATVCEAVGQVLGDKCPEMVVKHGDSSYLYQRTYTTEAKDDDSQNVFIPVSVYGLLVERMVSDVIEKGIVESVVKHSVLKQNLFLMKLKDELHKGNSIRDFLMAESRDFFQNVSEGKCTTFLQYVLQSDEDTVRLVYSHFMEFLACTHNNNSSDCWQCKEKQTLLELGLYYHHFQIADKLITMNACYTHLSLCNAARHGDLNRVQTIMEYLKRSEVFNPECVHAKKALCRAYLSRSQDVTEILLQKGITLDSMHVVHAVQHGDISVLMKVMEHLKYHSKWHPHWDKESKVFHFLHPYVYSIQISEDHFASRPCSTALYITYCSEKFDMADFLLKNEAKVSLKMLAAVTEHSSKEAVARVIQHLKVNCIWDPLCDAASEVLGSAYKAQKYDACDLLAQEGVSITMKYFPHVILSSLDYVKTIVKQLKDTDIWNPKCKDASDALAIAYRQQTYDVCDLLIQEGASLTMENLPLMVGRFNISFEAVKKAVQHLKHTNNNHKCDDASKALEEAYGEQKYDVCDLLIQEGISLTMKNIPGVVYRVSLKNVKKAIHHWNKFAVCDLLIRNLFSSKIKNLHLATTFQLLETVKKAMEHLKDYENWDAKSDEASEALENAFSTQNYDVCDLLLEEAVSLTMKNFPGVVGGFVVSLEAVKKAMQHLKATDNWDPKCDDASKALANAYSQQKYDVCDLLIQEGVSLTMQNLVGVVEGFQVSLEAVKKALKHLKDTDNWDASSEHASNALENAYVVQKYDVCDLLIQEGILLSMKNVPGVVYSVSLEYVKKAIQHWNKYDLFELLVLKRVSLTMKNLPCAEGRSWVSLEAVKKVIRHLKDTEKWDPRCGDASKAFASAYSAHIYDVCDLLVLEGVLPNNEESSSYGGGTSGINGSS